MLYICIYKFRGNYHEFSISFFIKKIWSHILGTFGKFLVFALAKTKHILCEFKNKLFKTSFLLKAIGCEFFLL